MRETKSQKVSCAARGLRPAAVRLFFLTEWTRSGNFTASWMKNTGMLLPTMSQLPSVGVGFTAKPRTSRGVSGDLRLPATVEKRTNLGPIPRAGRSLPASGRDRLEGLRVAVRSGAAGVHDPLGDALVVEVEDLLPQREVLEQRRPTVADP